VSTFTHRILWIALPILWVAALGSAAGAVYLKHRSRELFVELERLDTRRDNLDIEWGQLQLEQSAWSTHAFVERVASAKLRMAMPPPKEMEILSQGGRTRPAPRPRLLPFDGAPIC
jgi:cell division protein FtsL